MGWRRRRAEDRAVEQWRRELERHLEEPLDLSDLGPSVHRLDGGLPRPAPPVVRRTRGPLLPALLVLVAIAGFVMISNPGSTGYWIKELVRRASGDASSSYAFLRTTTSTGEPVAWSHCEPIHYVVNPQAGPPGWKSLVRSATDEVAEASGFELVYDGTSRARDFTDRRPGGPVLIGWAAPTEFDALAGDVAGFGGPAAVVVDGRARFVTGGVVLDSEHYAQLAGLGDDEAMRLILVHELGHVMGLDHVDDPHQLMYPTYVDQSGLGDGDVEGLRRLHDVPCGAES